ncbi:cyclic nucleotide-binding domain-containing protein [Acinetobacter haemolyticus]|uniref:Crp/Fnr family transcriptional regulator n=1 Tax=Acinetobacter haemolyticus TaxID=29430 RepID=A0A4P7B6L0_ACIHA|nr:Crp/Fnr family transcriptional regulator [Acinetobacter haemolyticus]NAR18092.1 cyclic nucleotide-binding domain-containing protein [Acinetobacter haemolyticus]NAR29321.1 cyclic nucleotide-binding domain-containing protein [Acinetobacter haemolyticus]NAR34918.1 cyclic nucleotide-binding domain-containing protein [Acinetobacter haemolyticus]NAR48166.1 cyclic nucleotide-binding domain-containing protein [Acinetobacter haemolyticus]NAR63433.1 cyclic nucleotide-binding domain-containing protein
MLDPIYIRHLQQNAWFSQLTEPFQQFVIEHGKKLVIEKNAAVFHAQDQFDGVYGVLEGSISLGYIDVNGNEAIAAIAEPIMWFGEISLIDNQPRSHDAIALKKSVVLQIPGEPLKEFLLKNPYYWYYFALLTSQKLRYVFLEQIAIQTQTISQRLAQRLLFILEGYGNRAAINDLNIQISQDQLANMLTVSRQTVNQELNHFEKQGVIQLGFKKIQVIDLNKLKLLSKKGTLID